MDFEGTILTEGMGVGRGTRFATSESKTRLDTGGRQRGIEGGKGGISQGAATSIDPGSVSLRARPLDPLQTKPIITDGSGVSARAISNTGEILSRAAFDYADRRDENMAVDAVLAFNERARKAFYGDPDSPDDKGLSGLEGRAAVEARGSFFDSIDQDYANTIARLSPSVKQKALARLSSIRDTALNRAAGHIAQQQHVYDLQQRARVSEDIARELPLDYANAPNLKMGLLKQFGQDSINGNKAWDAVALDGAHRLYMDSYKRSNQDAPTGMPNLIDYRERVKDTMSVDALNDLDEYIKAQQQHEISAQKAAATDAKNRRKEQLEALVTEAYKYYDKNPGTFRSASEIAQVPELRAILTDQQATDAVLRYADRQRTEKATGKKEEDRIGLTNALIDLKDEGVVFNNFLDFASFANGYGVFQGVKELYNAQQEPLAADERMVQAQYKEITKSAYSAFMYEEGGGTVLPPPTGNKAQDLMARFSAMASSTKKNVKPEPLQRIENALFAIYHDKDLKPFEKSQKMTEFIESEAKKAGATDEMAKINPVPILAQQFLVKNYYAKLQGGDAAREEQWGSTSSLVGQPRMDMVDGVQLPSAMIVEQEEAQPEVNPAELEYHKNVFKNAGTAVEAESLRRSLEAKGFKDPMFVNNIDASVLGGKVGERYTGYVAEVDGRMVRIQPKNRVK